MQNTYETVVGLEIHVELSTQSKMFCRCAVPTLQDKPNTRTCPVCLGLPGALPFPNKQAVEDCIKIGLALNCSINTDSFFERKNYFYPDLAKGFQTSQYLHPFGEKGYLDIKVGNEAKRIGITRVHMEEDTGKLTHSIVEGKEVSLIDFNRSGVPLVEIVTEPDIRNGEEARIFLTELQKIIRYLNVSDADMEKGHMRLEPNISLRPVGQKELAKYKVEVKNINSFKFVEKAIEFEEKRHKELLDKEETPIQETRGWNEFKNKTVSQRSKEEAHDYRYFPEPDIPPIEFTQEQIEDIRKQIPILPEAKAQEFINMFDYTPYMASLATITPYRAEFMTTASGIAQSMQVAPAGTANYILNKRINDIGKVSAEQMVKDYISITTVEQYDPRKLEEAIRKILSENQKAVEEYKAGKIQLLGFFIGQTKKVLPDAKDTEQIRKKLLEMLE